MRLALLIQDRGFESPESDSSPVFGVFREGYTVLISAVIAIIPQALVHYAVASEFRVARYYGLAVVTIEHPAYS